MIFSTAYSARMDSSTVKVPGPAISGKTIGTKVLEPPGASFLNISTPNIISMEIMKITKDPAAANDDTSTLNNLSIKSPTKRNATIMMKEYSAACFGFTSLFSF